ncbi:MAG: nuclear transport factor 2 family protein, partial [Acidimicrobiales bacterium]
APERSFRDPVTAWTGDVRAVAEHTAAIFPDWSQHIETIRGGDGWAVFEWRGGGTYRGPGAEDGPGFPVTMEGATIVEVDGEGRVTRWRDYLDTNEAIGQVMAGLQAAGSPAADASELTADWEAHFSDEPQV